MLPSTTRIICVGFQKTGTTSISEALRRLGYSSCMVHREINAALEAKPGADARAVSETMAIEALKTHDVIEDSPMPFVYEALDRAYPGSKFILTWRPTDKWMDSYTRFFPDTNNSLRAWMYGVDRLSGNEHRYREIYDRQNAKVREYFTNRPEDFLEMDLAGGSGWYDLISFLGRDALPEFPRANVGGQAREPRKSRTGLRQVLRHLTG